MNSFLQEYGKIIVMVIVIAALIAASFYVINAAKSHDMHSENSLNEFTTMNQLNENDLDDWNEPWPEPVQSVPSHN